MARNPREFEIGEFAKIASDIGTTDTHAMNSHNGFMR
jgi:hypothetical protein